MNSLYVALEFQGHGIGAGLLDLVRCRAASARLPVELSVLAPNTRALAFYRREGFEVVRRDDERAFMRWSSPSRYVPV